MKTLPRPTAPSASFACRYDAWNRLVQVFVDADSSGTFNAGDVEVARYEYDGTNRRAKAHVDSQAPANPDGIDAWRHFYYTSDWQVLETRRTTSAENDAPDGLPPEVQYVWSVRYVDALIRRDKNEDGTTDDLCDDEFLYALSDANQNVTALVNTAGTVLERYLYDPYGNVTVMDGSWGGRSGSLYDSTILFAGYWRDSETGLYHVRNRMYHVRLGLWLQRDPEGYVDGMSFYEYVRGGPANAVDAMGLAEFRLVGPAPSGQIMGAGNNNQVVWLGIALHPSAGELGKLAEAGGGFAMTERITQYKVGNKTKTETVYYTSRIGVEAVTDAKGQTVPRLKDNARNYYGGQGEGGPHELGTGAEKTVAYEYTHIGASTAQGQGEAKGDAYGLRGNVPGDAKVSVTITVTTTVYAGDPGQALQQAKSEAGDRLKSQPLDRPEYMHKSQGYTSDVKPKVSAPVVGSDTFRMETDLSPGAKTPSVIGTSLIGPGPDRDSSRYGSGRPSDAFYYAPGRDNQKKQASWKGM